MIVNHSALREPDLDFINGQLRRQPKQIALRVIAIAAGLFFLLVAVAELTVILRHGPGKVSDWILMIAFALYAYLLLSRGIFTPYFARRRSKKYQSVFAPRTYTVTAEGIAAHHVFEGVETNNKFSFANADCYYEAADAVFLRFLGEKKQQFYMCFQDGGYREGSRAELIALLHEKGIRKG